MGMTSVNLTIKNPYEPSKKYKGRFLVDSGAQFTVLPKKVWQPLGLTSHGVQEFELADGKVISRPVGNAFVQFRKLERATPVVLGESDDSPLLGVLTLEAFGLTLDPLRRKLYKADLRL